VKGTTSFTESWKKTFILTNPLLGVGDKYQVWVEKGWLQASRETAAGQTDWHIVVARATDARPPTIVADSDLGSFSLSYLDGRYFVRETASLLRCVRERKTDSQGTWPRSHFLDAKYAAMGSAGSASQPPVLTGWMGTEWFVAATGPTNDQVDCLVRLNLTKAAQGYGFEGMRDVGRVFHGDKWLLDDGQLLVATRGIESLARAKIERDLARERLPGMRPPALDGKDWYNAKGPISWQDLHGKVVLVDFWATWCSPCMKKLPALQALYEKFKGKGLVVIGVHSPDNADKLPAFMEKHQISFPVVLDAGKTFANYGIEAVPAYVLVAKSGKVLRALTNDLPTESEIQELLSK
jgi:peroxiredoxin